MVKITQPPSTSPVPRPANRTQSVDTAAPTHREKLSEPVAQPFVERRRNKEDRRLRNNARGPFDMRRGRDRRKNSTGHPSVEDEA